MHIVVCMKQVVDLEQLRIKADTREPVLTGLPVKLGDFDKNALEAAVQLVEEGVGSKVTVVAAGTPKLRDTIKEALAIGADEAVLLIDEAFAGSEASGSARLLARAIEELDSVDLVIVGEGSDDEYSGQVPGRLSQLLGVPLLTYVRELSIDDGSVVGVQDFEEELVSVRAELPAVVGVTSELNVPRLPPLTAILKAASKPVHEWSADDLGLTEQDVGPASTLVDELSNLAPLQDRKGMIYEDPDEGIVELVKALRREGVID